MRRSISALMSLVATFAAFGFAPTNGHAGPCDSHVYIFQETQQVATAYLPGLACEASKSADARVLLPVTDSVYVRWVGDLGEEVPVIDGVLNGLGFDNTPIKLNRVNLGAAGIDVWAYDSDSFNTPGGLPALGCLTATVTLPDSDPATESNTLASPGSTC